jgi:hypothetical protein
MVIELKGESSCGTQIVCCKFLLAHSFDAAMFGACLSEEGRAGLRTVEVGERTPFTAEIKSGVEADAVLIVHPANEITDGTRVQPREQKYLGS